MTTHFPMLRFFARLALSTLLFSLVSPALAFTQPTTKEFTGKEKERILLPCRNTSADRRVRCEVKELKRAQLEWGKSSPMDAYAVYDWLDLGGQRLRDRLQQERSTSFQQYWEDTRRVYSDFEPTDDINTQRLPYVNRVRESRLDCMYVQHGRARTLCFDKQVDLSQKMMHTPPQ